MVEKETRHAVKLVMNRGCINIKEAKIEHYAESQLVIRDGHPQCLGGSGSSSAARSSTFVLKRIALDR